MPDALPVPRDREERTKMVETWDAGWRARDAGVLVIGFLQAGRMF